MHYSSFDYLCNEPYHLPNICNLKCPSLRDIRKITYNKFLIFLNILYLTPDKYIELLHLEANSIDKSIKNNLFLLLLYTDLQLLNDFLSFFVTDICEFHKEGKEFLVFSNHDKSSIGSINKDSFESVLEEIKNIIGINQNQEDKKPKFKNEYTQKMYESIKENTKKSTNEFNEDYTLENMIKKYCTHNKVGINILNVWELTYHQFNIMFEEYQAGRQFDFNDKMAANTFSYKDSKDYKPMDYMKKLNKNT